MQDTLAALDSAFAKAALTKSYVVYRGIGPALETTLASLKPGQVVSSPRFSSATTSLKRANKFGTNLIRIVVNKGTPAISMGVLTGVPGDVLLNRGQQLIFDGVGRAGEFMFHT